MGKLAFVLSVIMISAIVTSLIVNSHTFRVINQLNSINDQIRDDISDLQLQIQTMQQELDPYKQHIEGLYNLLLVNKTVVIEGKLVGPLAAFLETSPPWNYMLFGPNETMETIKKSGTVAIGVLWNGGDQYAFENVIVTGVGREGRYYSMGHTSGCYYIEAQEIVRL